MTFEELYDEHVWTVYGFLAYRTASREEAEDLTQVTFEKALKGFARFDRSKASESTWLIAIARNVLVDAHRARSSRPATTFDERALDAAVDERDPLHGIEVSADPALWRALEQLGEREREIIALRFGADLDGPAIAEVTGLTLANVQQILSRTLRKLRQELEG